MAAPAAALALAAGSSAALPATAAPAAVPAAAGSQVEVAARVLVLDDRQPMVGSLIERLTKEGVPFTRVDLGSATRPQITEDFLATTTAAGLRANYMGVITPSETPMSLSEAERATLASYEQTFKVREVLAYTWANPAVGLDYAGYTGAVDGLTATLTDAAQQSGFSYLRGQVPLDDVSSTVTESFGYLAKPLAAPATGSFTPLLTAPIPGSSEQGVLMGVHADAGRERLVSTFASNGSQHHARALSHGIITWLTRGVSASFSRNYMSVHIDDVLLPDSEWSREGNCTIGADCNAAAYPQTAPGSTSRMNRSDVEVLSAWQQATGLKQDMVYNANGAVEEKARTNGTDDLEAALLARKSEMRWINHTWSHAFLTCTQDATTSPWSCGTTPEGGTAWVPQSVVESEISRNTQYAKKQSLPSFNRAVLVTGEHSGLQALPHVTGDNPNVAPALATTGIAWIASDASRERDPRLVGSATTVPRHPMNIFYNTSTKAGAVDEYNWIYTSRANGGSGLCEDNPDISTCIEPLGPDGFDTYIAPRETHIALGHVLDNDARPHYAHQSNLTNDRILYPVLDGLIARYKGLFASSAPLVNPSMEVAGQRLVAMQAWRERTGDVQATIKGQSLSLTNTSDALVSAPVTVPLGTTLKGQAFGESYGGQSSQWLSLPAGTTRTLTMPAAPGFAQTATWGSIGPAPTVLAAPESFKRTPTRPVKKNEASARILPGDH